MIDHICHELGLFDLISKESTIAVPRNSRNSFNQDLDAEVQPLASIFPSSAVSAAERARGRDALALQAAASLRHDCHVGGSARAADGAVAGRQQLAGRAHAARHLLH